MDLSTYLTPNQIFALHVALSRLPYKLSGTLEMRQSLIGGSVHHQADALHSGKEFVFKMEDTNILHQFGNAFRDYMGLSITIPDVEESEIEKLYFPSEIRFRIGQLADQPSSTH